MKKFFSRLFQDRAAVAASGFFFLLMLLTVGVACAQDRSQHNEGGAVVHDGSSHNEGQAVGEVPYATLDTEGQFVHHVVYDWMSSANTNFNDINVVEVGEEVSVPDGTYTSAVSWHFHRHARSFVDRWPGIVSAWETNGRPMGGEFRRFIAEYITRNQASTTAVEQGIAKESSGTQVAEEGTVRGDIAEASLPLWLILWMVIITVGLGAVAYLLTKIVKRFLTFPESLSEMEERLARRMAERLPPVTDDSPMFSELPYRNPGSERSPEQVYDDLRGLSSTHLGNGWVIDRDTIEEGVIKASDLKMFLYNPHGEVLREKNTGRIMVTAYRALARNKDEEEQFVYALGPCMNYAVQENDDFEFIAGAKLEVDPLYGTSMQIIGVNRTDDAVELTLSHPDIEETLEVSLTTPSEEEVVREEPS